MSNVVVIYSIYIGLPAGTTPFNDGPSLLPLRLRDGHGPKGARNRHLHGGAPASGEGEESHQGVTSQSPHFSPMGPSFSVESFRGRFNEKEKFGKNSLEKNVGSRKILSDFGGKVYIEMFFLKRSRWCCFFLEVSKGRRVGHLWWSAGKWSHHVLKDHMPFLQPGTTQVLLHCRVDQPERCRWNIAIFCNVPVEWFSILS